MNWSFFASWCKTDLQQQKNRTLAKIEAIKKMLSENPDNFFLANQLSQQLEKLKAVENNLK